MPKKMFSLFLIIIFFPVSAEIITHTSLQELADHIARETYVPHETVIAFDLDNTLMHPQTEVGSDQWFEHQIKQITASGISATQAHENLLQLYYKIQHIIDQHLIEDMAPAFIDLLKKSGFTVIGLTARYRPIMDRTLAQLARINIHFSQMHESEFFIEGFQKKPVYKNGVIFCSTNNKGHALMQFLKQVAYMPKKIICLDDKKHHLERVEKSAYEHGIECLCIHYLGCKERVDNFDPIVAEKELHSLGLTDHPHDDHE